MQYVCWKVTDAISRAAAPPVSRPYAGVNVKFEMTTSALVAPFARALPLAAGSVVFAPPLLDDGCTAAPPRTAPAAGERQAPERQ